MAYGPYDMKVILFGATGMVGSREYVSRPVELRETESTSVTSAS